MQHPGHARVGEPPHSEGTGHWLLHTLRREGHLVRRRDGQQGERRIGGCPKLGQRSPRGSMEWLWQIRMRINKANLAGFSAQPKRQFQPPRSQSTRKQGIRKN